jgi:hypothetical protein
VVVEVIEDDTEINGQNRRLSYLLFLGKILKAWNALLIKKNVQKCGEKEQ